jgi:hypothetical protein
MKRLFTTFCLVGLVLVGGRLEASTITFVPPNDTVGAVFTTNTNDGYFDGRGDVFQVTAATTINSIGIFQNLTNIVLSYAVLQTLGASGDVNTGEVVLRSGSALTTTAGLQWIDFGFAPLVLGAGNFYHFEFQFNGNANQNFFYNNANVSFSVGPFSLVDGTQNGNASNSVMPAIRTNVVDAAPVPEPASILLLGSGAVLTGLRRWRNRRRQD